MSAGDVLDLARPDIRALAAYDHAEWRPTLVRLHANELPWRTPGDASQAGLNRYPEPQPRTLVERLAALYGVAPDRVLVGRGSDEGIDLLVRAFCRAGEDAVLVSPPTFGMYAVAARIQGAKVEAVPLVRERGYVLDAAAVLARCAARVKLVFVCTPNNPTGNAVDEDVIVHLLRTLGNRALVVVDEAYLEFTRGEFTTRPSLARRLDEFPNLVVLRTLSKAHGLAGARVGTLIAAPRIVALLRKIIPPYAMPVLTVEAALAALEPANLAVSADRIATIVGERERLSTALRRSSHVTHVWPSEANFVLVEFADANRAFETCCEAGLLVRQYGPAAGLGNALRITIGTPDQNDRLIASFA